MKNGYLLGSNIHVSRRDLGGASGEVAALATGGIITTFGAYTIHAFLASGDFEIISGITEVDVLVIPGGGGGGSSQSSQGGGGGGGACAKYTPGHAITTGVHPVVVGAGGLNATANTRSQGSDGGISSFDGIQPNVPGGGGGDNTAGRNGGSGGGEGGIGSPPGTGIAGIGFAGGFDNTPNGGPGGGAGEIGGGTDVRRGGKGLDMSAIFGTDYGDSDFPGWFAGGGAPGWGSGATPSDTGGKGGGGDSDFPDFHQGQDGTGGGGSGSYIHLTPGRGGNGGVYIRYLT